MKNTKNITARKEATNTISKEIDRELTLSEILAEAKTTMLANSETADFQITVLRQKTVAGSGGNGGHGKKSNRFNSLELILPNASIFPAKIGETHRNHYPGRDESLVTVGYEIGNKVYQFSLYYDNELSASEGLGKKSSQNLYKTYANEQKINKKKHVLSLPSPASIGDWIAELKQLDRFFFTKQIIKTVDGNAE